MSGQSIRPILIGKAEEIDLVRPDVRRMLENPGVWIGGDTRQPDVIVPLWSDNGVVYSLAKDEPLHPERFLPEVTLRGPFHPNGGGDGFPRIVCICGSTRFWREFQKAGLDETLAGRIVLSIGAASGTDDDHFGKLPRDKYDAIKFMLDELHKRKIDLSDEILVLNKDGYVGSSTRSEIEYANKTTKRIRWMENDKIPDWFKKPTP